MGARISAWKKVLGFTGVVLALSAAAWMSACRATGGQATGERLARMRSSPQWNAKEARFDNRRRRVDGPAGEMMKGWFFGKSEHATPAELLPVVPRTRGDFDAPPAEGLRITWLGHSTLLVELDGRRLLIDPVWGERASPFSFAGPKRWYAPPLPLEELPEIDAILISHDHYDHLDVTFVDALLPKRLRWLVPLGVGAHLERWGVEPELITELDWWEASEVGGIEVTATPSRHFSGRWLDDQCQTLWAGWAMRGPRHNVYYSGDTALFDEMVNIGRRLGPFDLTMIEVGAYDQLWADVHLGPEQAVRAHRLVRGGVFVPVHWGLFDLALHGWTEPIERVLVAAEQEGVTVAAPRPGESVELGALQPTVRWWPSIPWRTAEEAPVRSTGVQHLMTTELGRPAPRRQPAAGAEVEATVEAR